MRSARAAAPAASPRAALAVQVRAFVRELEPAHAGQPATVHRVRVAARRLRLALRLFAAQPASRRARAARRSLKRMLDRSSRGRDSQIAWALLSTLLVQPDAVERRLLTRLGRQRRRARQALSSRLSRRRARRARRRVRRATRASLVDSATARVRLTHSIEQQGEALEKAIADLGRRLAPRRLHAVRIACRRLRYTGELLGALTGRRLAALPALSTLQACLGGIQDAQVLMHWLRREQGRVAGRADPSLATALRRCRGRVRAVMHAHHARYLRQRPGARVAEALTELRAACVSAP